MIGATKTLSIVETGLDPNFELHVRKAYECMRVEWVDLDDSFVGLSFARSNEDENP